MLSCLLCLDFLGLALLADARGFLDGHLCLFRKGDTFVDQFLDDLRDLLHLAQNRLHLSGDAGLRDLRGRWMGSLLSHLFNMVNGIFLCRCDGRTGLLLSVVQLLLLGFLVLGSHLGQLVLFLLLKLGLLGGHLHSSFGRDLLRLELFLCLQLFQVKRMFFVRRFLISDSLCRSRLLELLSIVSNLLLLGLGLLGLFGFVRLLKFGEFLLELGSFLDRIHHFLGLLGQFIVSLFRCNILGRGCELLLDLGNDRIFFGGN